MKLITLLPADKYIVINKTILSDQDRITINTLYAPIIGASAVGLFFSLWNDLDQSMFASTEHSHHHLMTILKMSLEEIKRARESLESMGLLRTYYKEGDLNEYVYELYSPLSPAEFFDNAIYNVVLYNNVGKSEYDNLVKKYQRHDIKLDGFKDITKKLNEVYEPLSISSPALFCILLDSSSNISTRFAPQFSHLVASLLLKCPQFEHSLFILLYLYFK